MPETVRATVQIINFLNHLGCIISPSQRLKVRTDRRQGAMRKTLPIEAMVCGAAIIRPAF
ncbi:MAG: hypothetical protein P8X96_06070 [Desulfobacteraceae bacterium]